MLGVDAPSDELLEDLERPMSFADLVEPFDDVATFLPRFRLQGWSIAVVADTSAGMIDAYRAHELDQLIDVFVISAELGVPKPDRRMYRTASDALGLDPERCVFVDDHAGNVQAALDLGYGGCGMSRYGPPPDDHLTWVHDLAGLASFLTEHDR
jgi:putative hydrolase of the HAD superfamily